MSFTITLRQGPARMAARLPQLSKTVAKSSNASLARAFHQSSRKQQQNAFFTSKNSALVRVTPKISTSNFLVSRLSAGSKRGYQTQAPAMNSGSTMQKLLMGGAIFGGTMVAINMVFNRETRDDGGMPVYEREYLNNTFLHTGFGIGIIALTARQMVNSGFVYRLMVTNPWAVGIGGLALSFGTMIGTRMVDPDK